MPWSDWVRVVSAKTVAALSLPEEVVPKPVEAAVAVVISAHQAAGTWVLSLAPEGILALSSEPLERTGAR